MSTVTDLGPEQAIQAAPVEAAPLETVRPRRRRRTALLLLFGLVLLVAAVAGIGGGALYAWDAGYEAKVLPGVTAGGVPLDGLTRDQAATALASRYAFGDGSLVLRTPDGDVTIPFAELGRRADVDPVVDAALASGRAGSTLDRAVAQLRQALEGRSIEAPGVVFDEAAVRARVTEAVEALDRYPTSATITMTKAGITVTRARTGRDADAGPVVDAALAVLGDPRTTGAVVLPVGAETVRPRVEDAAVMDARTQAVRMVADLRITAKKQAWTIRAKEIRRWIRFAPAPGGQVTVVIDTSRIPAQLKKAAKAVKKAPKDAEYLRARNGGVVGVVASSAGRKLDRAATIDAIVAELESRAAGGARGKVRVVTAPLAPEISTEEASKKAPVLTLLGSWQTWFPISERNYFGANIWIPAQLINGTVLKPGQSFDWWRAIWPVTPARGFGPGGFIASDHTEPTGALGGGMCSSSTTLFNAAMRAGLDIGSRHNHKYYISRYPLGLDATVSATSSGPVQTMSFRNDTKGIIYIRGERIRSGGIGWVRYEIYGVPDGRKVSLSGASVRNLRKATTTIVYVDTLPKGVKEQVEYPSDGMTTSVTRVVRDRKGRVIHRDTWVSNYVLWNGVINVGR